MVTHVVWLYWDGNDLKLFCYWRLGISCEWFTQVLLKCGKIWILLRNIQLRSVFWVTQDHDISFVKYVTKTSVFHSFNIFILILSLSKIIPLNKARKKLKLYSCIINTVLKKTGMSYKSFQQTLAKWRKVQSSFQLKCCENYSYLIIIIKSSPNFCK